MANDDEFDDGSELRRALGNLAKGAGIQRDDLLEALNGELSELRRYWGVNLGALGNADREIELQAARRTVRTNLNAHVSKLIPPSVDKRGIYRHAVLVSFNLLGDAIRAGLKESDLTARRKWLAKQAPDELRVSESTSQRYLRHAIAQIEGQMLSADYKPAEVSVNTDIALVSVAPVGQGEAGPADREITGSPPEPDGSQQDQHAAFAEPTILPVHKPVRVVGRQKAVAILIAVTVVSIAAVIFVVYGLFKPTDSQSQSAGGSSPVPVAASSPLVAVANVTGMNSLDGDLRFVTPTRTTMSPGQLAAFNSDVILKSANFSPWYAAHGAVPVNVGVASITLRGSTSETVRITNIEAIKDCKAPYTGTIFTGYTQGGPSGTVKIGMNLDDPQPVARELAVTSEGFTPFGPGYFLTNTLDLAPGDLMTITLGAFTKHYGCSFKLRLTIVTSHGSYYQDIDDAGHPFRVTAEAPAAKAGYPDSGYQTAYAQGPSTQWSAVDPQTYQGP